MTSRIGIGLITYNRRDLAAQTITCVREFTRHAPTEFIVADDGSGDGTAELCKVMDICCVTGPNRGIAWNKNRALFMLNYVLNCDVTILLEDDTQPANYGWEAEWIAGATRWGHVGLAAPWIEDTFLSGSGTAADPVIATGVTAQCTAYSRASLREAGYFDSRFRGYGEEHVEHTTRLIRHGFGGTISIMDGCQRDLFYLLRGEFVIRATPSHYDDDEVRRNRALAVELSRNPGRRDPWCDASEKAAFDDEIRTALMVTPPSPLKFVTFL